MKKFEVGCTYKAAKTVFYNYSNDIEFKCIKRTAKTVTFVDDFYGDTIRRKIQDDGYAEYFMYDNGLFKEEINANCICG